MGYNFKTVLAVCVIAGLTIHGTDGAVTQWTGVAATTATDAVVSKIVGIIAVTGATGSADVSFRDGLTSTNGPQITVTATAASAIFTLDATSLNTFDIALGVISVKSGVTLSYASASTFTMTVTATDAADTGDLTLNVTVNGMPTFSSTPICLYIADATLAGTTLYTYTIADPDTPITAVTTTITGTSNYFTSPVVSGNLITTQAMAKATVNLFIMTIMAVDAGSPPSTASTTLVVLVLDAGVGTGTCSSGGNGTGTCSGGTVVIGSVMTTMALLTTYFL